MEVLISPCGADCQACQRYPNECSGCAEIKGVVWWAEYTDSPLCGYYECCVQQHELSDCGQCGEFPCEMFDRIDPQLSDEENAAIRAEQIAKLTRTK